MPETHCCSWPWWFTSTCRKENSK